jgi:hypothetical protein
MICPGQLDLFIFIYVITDNKLTDPVCGQINLKVNDNQEKHKRTALPPKRIQCPPQKCEKDFFLVDL